MIGDQNYVNGFAAVLARCDEIVGTSQEIAKERQATLRENAVEMLKTSEAFFKEKS